jgi:hypothetical protein
VKDTEFLCRLAFAPGARSASLEKLTSLKASPDIHVWMGGFDADTAGVWDRARADRVAVASAASSLPPRPPTAAAARPCVTAPVGRRNPVVSTAQNVVPAAKDASTAPTATQTTVGSPAVAARRQRLASDTDHALVSPPNAAQRRSGSAAASTVAKSVTGVVLPQRRYVAAAPDPNLNAEFTHNLFFTVRPGKILLDPAQSLGLRVPVTDALTLFGPLDTLLTDIVLAVFVNLILPTEQVDRDMAAGRPTPTHFVWMSPTTFDLGMALVADSVSGVPGAELASLTSQFSDRYRASDLFGHSLFVTPIHVRARTHWVTVAVELQPGGRLHIIDSSRHSENDGHMMALGTLIFRRLQLLARHVAATTQGVSRARAAEFANRAVHVELHDHVHQQQGSPCGLFTLSFTCQLMAMTAADLPLVDRVGQWSAKMGNIRNVRVSLRALFCIFFKPCVEWPQGRTVAQAVQRFLPNLAHLVPPAQNLDTVLAAQEALAAAAAAAAAVAAAAAAVVEDDDGMDVGSEDEGEDAYWP